MKLIDKKRRIVNKIFYRQAFMLVLIVIVSPMSYLNAIVVGSETSPSVQGTVIFPATDNNNTMLGFASFENGFILQDNTTSVSFDSVFPISGPIVLNGGTVELNKDINFFNISNIQAFGKFIGNSHSIEFAEASKELCLTSASGQQCYTSLTSTATATMGASVRSVSWSFDDTYVAGASEKSGTTEINVWSFNGTTLTPVASKEIDEHVYSIDWHPSQNVLAVTSKNIKDESGADLVIYRLVGSSLTKLDAESFSNSKHWGYGVEWSPNGNFLAVTVQGTTTTATTEIRIYSFDGVSTLTLVDTIEAAPEVLGLKKGGVASLHSPDAITWSPDGACLAIGLQQSLGSSSPIASSFPDRHELQLYAFDGANLTFKHSLDVDLGVLSLDWCSNADGSFIAAGLQEPGSNLVRIYKYNPITETISELTSAREGENRSVQHVRWNAACTCLLLGLSNLAGSQIKIYSFDTSNFSLVAPISTTSSNTIYSAVFSHNEQYLATGSSGSNVRIFTLTAPAGGGEGQSDILIFEDATVIFNSDVQFKVPIRFKGESVLWARGHNIEFVDGGSLQVDASAWLTIVDTHFSNVGGSNIIIFGNDSSITLKNTELVLAQNFTFSTGGLIIGRDSIISGTNTFVYSTRVSSTIESGATLLLDKGITFSYDPKNGNRNLIQMEDQTAALYMNGSTLHSTHTGLYLSTGTLILDNHSTLTSEGRNTGEALQLSPDLTICVLSAATVDLFGQIKYC